MIDFFLSLVLYSHNHNDINHNCNTIHTHIQLKTGGLCCSCTNAFINILTSVFRHEVRDTILIMLIILSDPHQPAAHLTMFKISVGRDPKKPTTSSMVKIQLSTDSFSNSSNSQDHLFQAWRYPHSSPISCLGVYYDNGDCHILCARA